MRGDRVETIDEELPSRTILHWNIDVGSKQLCEPTAGFSVAIMRGLTSVTDAQRCLGQFTTPSITPFTGVLWILDVRLASAIANCYEGEIN